MTISSIYADSIQQNVGGNGAEFRASNIYGFKYTQHSISSAH